jgi:omega-6 fatty acid desaturase (delta-12 desaturase)
MKPIWLDIVAKYRNPSPLRSTWQICNSFVPFFFIWYLMFLSLEYSYWITLALAILAAGFIVRIFIIQHDCGHGSFFKSRKVSDTLGFICGVLTLIPYYHWRTPHAKHHAHAGNLDSRGPGEVLTLSVQEYLNRSKWNRLKYRLYRNPLLMFGLHPLFSSLLLNRLPFPNARKWNKEHQSVHWTNLILGAIIVIMALTIGMKRFLLIELPIILIVSTAGVWLFYIQHQFEDTYWEDSDNWDFAQAAMKGSSYYKLPKVLQWFTGNIGLHHVHHLSPRIPNYYLQKCLDENPEFQKVIPLTFWKSLKTISLKLWDEDQKKLVGFSHLKSIQNISA